MHLFGSFRGFLDQTSPCFMGCPLCFNPVAWWLSLHQLGHFQNPPQMAQGRSEEHTSELQSLMRISYAVFCLKKKTPICKDKNIRYKQNHDHTSVTHITSSYTTSTHPPT